MIQKKVEIEQKEIQMTETVSGQTVNYGSVTTVANLHNFR